MVSLRDKVALIVGGNSGIGKATAFAFADAGARVVVAARRRPEGLDVVEQLRARGAAAIFVALDVTVEDDIIAGVAATVAEFGRLDCAVNSAGICEDFGPVTDVDGAAFDRMMAVNVRGTLLGMKHQLRQMVAQGGGGSVVNVASILSHVGTPTGSAYVATKHAVLGITRSAALGHAKQGIRVNCVAPTAITGTPMVDHALANFPAVMEPVIAAIPMGRPGRADEVGRAIAWLSSDDAAFISGHSLAIDGAQVAA
ncbi:NAD(P)-dependent dehydrogenase, short-chain alcohol dehydrogenase family [Nannocystis exedens]|uniref:NAD(P)-dependent dehydrogenase, short-chain alcohol dehydrogenase family n=1 Tax=Nannocystis exedens TaxID=54 RepID=A0A1I2H0Z5_9BACT|nr:glucose 1-dehydrogenase [Nannocystis exedens]PCC67100.1 glucose dehydrogenase [Nannocystis exedens]SFF23755.1 NAD(P)-dependent dehydrogenase, short-chain alcohol dehydrogenase family [Nannocystis exedens]